MAYSLVQKDSARLALKKWPEHCFPVSLPIQYKPPFVELSTEVAVLSVVVMGDGTRTYLCESKEQAMAFEREFPTIAQELNPDVLKAHLESMIQ